MALAGLYGSKRTFAGPSPWVATTFPASSTIFINALNKAAIFIGYIETSDGGSHTIDTTGSSAIGWQTGSVTFANAGTTVKVGVAGVDTANGPPGRAANTAGAINFTVSKTLVGGGGGLIANAWQSHVPDSGTMTIANGDLVAICVQMTALGGADSFLPIFNGSNTGTELARPSVTNFQGGSTYIETSGVPNALLTFSDGARGWIYGSDVSATQVTRTWNSASATKEYGQLYQLPFPVKIYGLYGWILAANDFDIVLYSNPLGGGPVAEKTVPIDANTISTNTARRIEVLFPTPYTTSADQAVGVVFKPGGSNLTVYFKRLNAAGDRVTDPWGTVGYGISRASGAFVNTNSSLDHYYIGLLVGAFDAGGGAGTQVYAKHAGVWKPATATPL